MAKNYLYRLISETLKNRASNSKCILVTGPRQVGKSTILKHLYPDVKYVTFDNLLDKTQAENEPGLFLLNNPCPVILDEVQAVPSLFPYIKMECDKTDSYENFYLTGSQALELMKNVSESLAGRVSILELAGFSLREIFNVNFNLPFVPSLEYFNLRERHLKPYTDIWKIIHRGSYPELYSTERDWEDFYSSYVKTYIERDVNLMIKIKDESAFMRFLVAVAARTGQILNYADVSSDVGVSQVTIKEWISALERSGIIFLLQPYYSNNLNRAIKTPKLYFRDTGLVCFLTKWINAETLKNSFVAGNIFETFIVSEIIKSYTNAGRDYRFNVFYYRGKDKKKRTKNGEIFYSESEIDLIIEENGTLYPIEIKMTANPKAEMADAFDVLDKISEKKRGMGAIICQYEKKMFLKENLIVLPLNYL